MRKCLLLLVLCALLPFYCAFAEPQQHFQRSSVIQSIRVARIVQQHRQRKIHASALLNSFD